MGCDGSQAGDERFTFSVLPSEGERKGPGESFLVPLQETRLVNPWRCTGLCSLARAGQGVDLQVGNEGKSARRMCGLPEREDGSSRLPSAAKVLSQKVQILDLVERLNHFFQEVLLLLPLS